MHASNATRFEQGYREIASVGEIPGRDDPDSDILQLVYEWLRDERNGAWLMVLDNADDDDVFFGLDESNDKAPLSTFVPQSPNGSILITSRNMLAARNLAGPSGHVVQIEPMNEDDSLALLKTRVGSLEADESSWDAHAKALVQALEYIPLAITQAGSYIANRALRVSVASYLELFRQSESNQEHLLNNEDAKDLRRDPTVRHAIITTWQISFEQIRKMTPAATDLLALMSMLDRQGIPEFLLHDGKNQLEFEDALAPLLSFSLIRAEVGQQSFEMHRLVQLSARKWLSSHKQMEKWGKKVTAIMTAVFPNGKYETWTTCQALLPHSKEVIGHLHLLHDKEDRLNGAIIANNTGWYLHLRGQYKEAAHMHQLALQERSRLLGPEHPDTLASISNIASILEKEGDYREAEIKCRQVLEGRQKLLGPKHPDTLTSMDNLGLVLERQGRYAESEAMHRQALEGRREVLGHEHRDTLLTINNLGWVLEDQGRYNEVEAMYRQALEGCERTLGPEHVDTIACVGHLGLGLQEQGKFEEAGAMHRRALNGYVKILGPEHPETLVSAANLGWALERQGKYEEAEAIHRQALASFEKVLGPGHRDTLTSLSHLGSVLGRQGKHKEAEAMHRRAMEGYERMLGTEHPYTLSSINNLGGTLRQLGRYEEAEKMHRLDLRVSEKVLGVEHPDTLTSVQNIGTLLEMQGKHHEAEAMFRRAFEGREKVLGAEHPATLSAASAYDKVREKLGIECPDQQIRSDSK